MLQVGALKDCAMKPERENNHPIYHNDIAMPSFFAKRSHFKLPGNCNRRQEHVHQDEEDSWTDYVQAVAEFNDDIIDIDTNLGRATCAVSLQNSRRSSSEFDGGSHLLVVSFC